MSSNKSVGYYPTRVVVFYYGNHYYRGDTDDVSINSNTTASVSLFVSNSTRNTEPEEPVQTMSYKQLNDEQNDSLAEPPRYHDIIESAPKFETVPMTLETVPMPNSDKLSKSNELEKVDLGS